MQKSLITILACSLSGVALGLLVVIVGNWLSLYGIGGGVIDASSLERSLLVLFEICFGGILGFVAGTVIVIVSGSRGLDTRQLAVIAIIAALAKGSIIFFIAFGRMGFDISSDFSGKILLLTAIQMISGSLTVIIGSAISALRP